MDKEKKAGHGDNLEGETYPKIVVKKLNFVVMEVLEDMYIKIFPNGEVFTLDRVLKEGGRSYFLPGVKKESNDNGHGYYSVHFSNKKSQKRYYLHRLMAMAFISNWDESKEVNHKDFNRENNSLDNLSVISEEANKR